MALPPNDLILALWYHGVSALIAPDAESQIATSAIGMDELSLA